MANYYSNNTAAITLQYYSLLLNKNLLINSLQNGTRSDANAVCPVKCGSKPYLRQYSTYGDEW